MKFLLLLLFSVSSFAQTNEELFKKVEELSKKVEVLEAKPDHSEKFDVLSEEIESIKQSESSKASITWGGYGEFVYVNERSKQEDGQIKALSGNPKWDAQRFILYAAHDFSDRWKLRAEIEIEHADSIFLEQAQVHYTPAQGFNFQLGVLLIPVGITNLYHEPTTFFGVDRPEIAKFIIPTTWRENGLGIYGKIAGLSYQYALVNGLRSASGNTATSELFTKSGVRSGRQKASEANARHLAHVLRLDYQFFGMLGLGGSYYMGKAGGSQIVLDHDLWEAHLMFKGYGFDFKGMYTELKLGNTQNFNAFFSSEVAEKMKGYFAELGYNVFSLTGHSSQLLPFVRFEDYDTHSKVGAGITKDKSLERQNLVYGVNFKPVENLVFKADYTKGKNKAKTGTDKWKLGVGWNF